MSTNKPISINVPILARVEGEGALELAIRDNQIEKLQLKIYEPPRLFEKFLEGRSYTEVLDFVARICGICPVAYQMSASAAIEHCFQMRPSQWVHTMRRLFYCGEWIESHSMHIHFLALPDFLGFSSAVEMTKNHADVVKRGIRLQAFGDELIALLGGRSVHPVGACIGGFFRAPDRIKIKEMLKKAEESIDDCVALITWLSTLSLPNNTQDFVSVSLYNENEYPMNVGNIISNTGLNISVNEFDAHFKEHQVPYSNALHCLFEGNNYLVGPLARINHCYEMLPDAVHKLASKLNLYFPSKNMVDSMMARALEIYACVLESIQILSSYEIPTESYCAATPKKGEGFGCTEAPRGLLWQHYQFDQDANVISARIVPPTSQNQARIEADLKAALYQFGLDQDENKIRAYSEMIIRNYDPCISCSTHFLKLTVKRLS